MGRFRVPSASFEEIGGPAGQAATPGASSSRPRTPTYITLDLDDDDEYGEEQASRSAKGKERAEAGAGSSTRAGRKNKDKSRTTALPQKKSVEDEVRDQARKKAKRDKLKKTVRLNSQKYIYVGNLSSNVTDLMLEEIFSSFGTVKSITMRSAGGYPSTSQPSSGRPRHHKYESRIYASVEFKNSVSVYRALQMNGEELCGHKLAIVRDALDLPEFSTMINEYIAPPSAAVPAQQGRSSGSSRQLTHGSRAKTETVEDLTAEAGPSTSGDRPSPSRLQPEHTNARIAHQFRPRVNADQQSTNTRSPTKSTRKQ